MENNLANISQVQLDALREITNIGAGTAATALSQFVNKKVDMAPPDIIVTSIKEVPGVIGREFPLVSVAVFGVQKQIEGHMLVIFEQDSSMRLVDILTGKPAGSTDFPFSEIDKSAFTEVTGVMSGAYLKAMGDFTNVEVDMVPPYFLSGPPNNILDFLVSLPVDINKPAICVKSDLGIIEAGTKLCGYMVFIPSTDSFTALLRFLGVGRD